MLDDSESPVSAMTVDGSSAAVSDDAAISVGQLPFPNWERYHILCVLGSGGMGTVYKARDRQLDRIVALKFLHGDDPHQVERFLQEAHAQARLEHPNLCRVFEVG